MNDLGHADGGVVLDELARNEPSGAVADENDLVVAELLEPRDGLGEGGRARNLLHRSRLRIGEGEDIPTLAQETYESAFRLLPAVELSLGSVLGAEGVELEPMKQEDGPRPPRCSPPVLRILGPRVDLEKERIDGRGLLRQLSQLQRELDGIMEL